MTDDRLIIAALEDLAASPLPESTRATLFRLALRELSQSSMPDAVASDLLAALFGRPRSPESQASSAGPPTEPQLAAAPRPTSASPEPDGKPSEPEGHRRQHDATSRASPKQAELSRREAPFVVTVSTPEGASMRTSVRVPRELLDRAAAASGGIAPLRSKVAQWLSDVPPGVSRSGWVKTQLNQVLDQH